MKEKIGMEKLIELLNEREEKEKTSKIEWRIDNNPTGIYGYVGNYGLGFASKMIIISKEYGFIKWLVEENKIDIVKVYENLTNYEIEIRIRAVKELLEDNEEDTIAYLKLLMLLSISDTPIEDLISYLK